MQKWKERRLLLHFDAMLWCKLFKDGDARNDEMLLDLAMLQVDVISGRYYTSSERRSDAAEAIQRMTAQNFTEERALELLCMADASL
jgi:hypothetical protein